MPELPDILAYIEALTPRVVGQPIERVRLLSPFLLRTVDPPLSEIEGKHVREVDRLGKRILFELDDDLRLVIHLMIAGRLRWRPRDGKLFGRMTLAAFDFPTGTLALTEAGTKRRASMHLVRGDAALDPFRRSGLNVLETSEDQFAERLRSESHTLKRALTDPRLFDGIGNAYSDEILHRARLSPLQLTRRLDDAGVKRLYQSIQSVLREWIDRLGAESREAFPEKVTAFREGMAVHGRFKQPCPVCGVPVQRIRYADNETNYCPRCQTEGRLLADRAMSRLLKEDWPRTLEELES
ncbi:MAG TPA: DNA-formamidopyrimidine glycosylase family protein [Gemmatimonadaceae bacterium]|nr:DNA-formamidopyrimidine glycosylase family protein [Gemmatimonadaceae bacterium]